MSALGAYVCLTAMFLFRLALYPYKSVLLQREGIHVSSGVILGNDSQNQY